MDPVVYDEIVGEILDGGCDVETAKTKVCRKYSLERVPSNVDILNNAASDKRAVLRKILCKKPVRTVSGVAIVAAMTSPHPCPHGRCLYCPVGADAPQSYTGFEPAALRGKMNAYDPFGQVSERLKQLHFIGHSVEKAELIIMGGTFPARTAEYQEWFVRRCFDAMNSFGGEPKGSRDVLEAHQLNERAYVRNVGVTFETRPDYAGEGVVDTLLKLGATRLELGVQTLREEVYEKVMRGHSLKEVVDATRIAKDAGLKVGYHMMPGLFSDFEQDVSMFERLFSCQDFCPDMLKIYPALVLEGTGLHKMWEKGEFSPLTDDECVELIVEIKKRLPKWTRTMRIQRDIPADLVKAGIRKGNLGELVEKELESRGMRCRCVRCREAGHAAYKKGVDVRASEIVVENYEASSGVDYFISAEDPENDLVAGYLRMRFPSCRAHRPEVDGLTAVIRELKVIGPALGMGERSSEAEQHKGLGSSLLERAEAIAAESGKEQLLVLSAVGTRGYYSRKGFERVGVYMGKRL